MQYLGIDLDPELSIPVGGETVAATRYKPTAYDEPLPLILIATPYRKDDWITFGGWDPSIRYFCHQGYEVVVADLLGTGASTGDSPPFHRSEGDQIATVIEWLADCEWTTGDIGMFGLFYGAWTQYVTAAVNPEPLKAIVPVAVSPSVYQSSSPGGVFNPMKRATWSVLMQTLRVLPPSRRDGTGQWLEIWNERLKSIETTTPWLFRFLGHEAKDDFWVSREVNPDEITVPTFAACGYRDDHTAPMVEFFDEIDAPKRLLLGPWRHRMPEQGRECAVDFRRQATAWFDHFLKGDQNDVCSEPTVVYWTEQDGGWTMGAGAWRGIDQWPTTQESSMSYAVTPDDLRNADTFTEGRFEKTYEIDHTVGVESLDRVGRVTNPGVPTKGDDARSLVVETDRIETPLEWTGTGYATLAVRPTITPLILAVRIADVDCGGAARLVSAGSLRASQRTDTGEPLQPGIVSPIQIPLKPKSHVFERGHKIRMAISGAYFPRALPLRTSGQFDIVSTPELPTEIVFPGRIHSEAVQFDNCITTAPPDTTVPTRSPFKTTIDSQWAVDRNHSTNSATLRMVTASIIDLPHGSELHTQQRVEAGVASDDPKTAAVKIDVAAELKYDTETWSVSTTSRVTRGLATLTTTVTVDGEPTFKGTWRRLDPMQK